MALQLVKPGDLPVAASVDTDAALVVQNGDAVEQATPAQIVDAGRPIASEVEAVTGTDNTKAMTPLTVRQAIDADTSGAVVQAQAAADAAEASALDAESAEEQTGLDALATAADRVQTGLDAAATAADRVQTGLDAAATGADAIATAADRVQTGLDAAATDADAIATAADRVQTGLDAASAAADAAAAAASLRAIGEPFALWDHITGCPVPSNAGTAKFIKLTAGLTGAGQYNEGLLTSESVSGSAPAITATAVIVGGPMDGQAVPLVNTEQAFIRPTTTSGVLQTSQNLSHRHDMPQGRDGTLTNPGAFVKAGYSNDSGAATAPTGTALGLNGGDEARPRNRSATFYMRIL
ncbi:MAG: hypothetical protein R3197_00280 [Paracoccaceae bacterium]|nr:hypothetical protein [Paracoccaceae bacterium]